VEEAAIRPGLTAGCEFELLSRHERTQAADNFQNSRTARDVSRLLRHANTQLTITVCGGLAPKEEEEILDGAVAAFAAVGV
jgi:hypothetical protein